MNVILHKIHIHIFEDHRDTLSSRIVRTMTQRALEEILPNSSTEISVVITDDETIRELNKYHRGLDEVTDVLSFSFQYQGDYYGDMPKASQWNQDIEFVLPPGEREGVGEIVISYPQAVRQAKTHKRSENEELAFLLAHGVLHLLGHDHENPQERTVMERTQTRLLSKMLRKQ